MAVMAPEAAEAAGGAAASAAGGLLGRGRTPVVDQGGGSAAAFMISIFLIMGAMICAWIAFHNPDELNPEQFPGLFRMILQWIQNAGEGAGKLPGDVNVGGLTDDIVNAAAKQTAKEGTETAKSIAQGVINALKTGFGLW